MKHILRSVVIALFVVLLGSPVSGQEMVPQNNRKHVMLPPIPPKPRNMDPEEWGKVVAGWHQVNVPQNQRNNQDQFSTLNTELNDPLSPQDDGNQLNPIRTGGNAPVPWAMDISQPANAGPILYNNGGAPRWTNEFDDYFDTYYNSRYVAWDLTNNQFAWFDLELPRTENRTYTLSYRIGVLGSSTERMSVYFYTNNAISNVFLLTSITGPGWPVFWKTEITNWTRDSWNISGNQPCRLRFYYTVGASVRNFNLGSNRGGIDYVTWEPAVLTTNDPLVLRIEKDHPFSPYHAYNGIEGEYSDSVKISFRKTDDTLPWPYANTYKMEYSTNGVWYPWSNQFITRPTYIDDGGTRRICYFPRIGYPSPVFFRLRRY